MQSPPASADATSVIILSLVFARPGASPRSRRCRTSSGRPRCRARVAGRSSPALVHQAAVVEGDLDPVGGVAWQHLLGAPFPGPFFLLQNHYPRSTGAPSCRLRTLTRRPPSVDSGLHHLTGRDRRQPSNQAHKTISWRGELAAPGSGGGSSPRLHSLQTPPGTHLALGCLSSPLMTSRIIATLVLDGARRYAPTLAGIPPGDTATSA